MSPQLSCDDTCQIWMRFTETQKYWCKTGNVTYGKTKEWSICNPTPVLSSRFANLNVYYFMILNTPSLAGDFYLNFFLVCGVEIPAYTVSIVIIKYVSWKRQLVFQTMFVCLYFGTMRGKLINIPLFYFYIFETIVQLQWSKCEIIMDAIFYNFSNSGSSTIRIWIP